MKQSIKPYLLGLLSGILLVSALGGYWYVTQPKPVVAEQTEMQKWVEAHPKQIEWTKNRFDKFHKAADDAFMESDATVIPSK